MDNCPTHRELEELMTEQVTGDAAEALRQHLQICPHCQARLDGMSDDLELRRWRRTPGSQDDDVPSDTTVIGDILKTTLTSSGGRLREPHGALGTFDNPRGDPADDQNEQ